MDARLPRVTRVKNKTPAPIQITAEQILREARECQQAEFCPPKHTINDPSELAAYRQKKRQQWEKQIRCCKNGNKSAWIKYAKWEESQNEITYARSIWERALDSNYRDHSIWLKYAEFEMKNKFINRARNVWDRAVMLLPRIDQLWYKYIHMEEMIGNVAGARAIFDRWMKWQPDEQAWLAYIRFEMRYPEVERVQAIYERFVDCHPKASSWIRFAKFEMKNGNIARARNCYERAVDKLMAYDDMVSEQEQLLVAFAEFEDMCKEIDRARLIYKFALDHLPKGRAEELHRKLTDFEKRYGDQKGIEEAIMAKKRVQYAKEVKNHPQNYDAWFDYAKLEESVGIKERIREVYDQAIVNLPPAKEKRYWQRYIYLWIGYALYEELDAGNMERAREVYSKCLQCIPHVKFSFSKIWLMFAEFEVRQLNLQRARLILGTAIGKAPKDKVFKRYIEIEMQLGNIDRCRKLYDKYLEWSANNCYAWIKYAELESSLAETERTRSVFELAVAQPALDMPELLWKAYMDFEISEGNFERVRALYERLLDRTQHLKVWLSFAKFEASAIAVEESKDNLEQKEKAIQRARGVLERALDYFRTTSSTSHLLREERTMLLEEWLNLECSFGELGNVELVRLKLPKKLKKRRQVETEGGLAGYEEYIDYVFPEETQTMNLKILEAAHKWKKQKS